MLRTLRKYLTTTTGKMVKVDSAITKLLNLDPSVTSMSSHGGGGMSSATTGKINTTLPDGRQKLYFMKTGVGRDAEIMFRGEHASLNALHNAVPTLCPASFGHGHLADSPSPKSFLVTDFLDLSSRRTGGSSSGISLAAKMAKLHTTPAPVPDGYDRPMFGFPATTCCGDTPQPNSYNASWAEFYKSQRLEFILGFSEERQGKDKELRNLVTQVCEKVVPRLIGDHRLNGGKGVTPVVCHGDLWTGNAGKGAIGSEGGEVEDLVFDPSAVYGHGEYDLGIMKMFGGFSSFFGEYQKLCPPTEPAGEYKDRIALYELYHHLNHHALFGGGYKSGAVSIMKDLIKKYGRDEL